MHYTIPSIYIKFQFVILEFDILKIRQINWFYEILIGNSNHVIVNFTTI